MSAGLGFGGSYTYRHNADVATDTVAPGVTTSAPDTTLVPETSLLQIPDTTTSPDTTIAPGPTLAPDTTLAPGLVPESVPTLGPDNGVLRPLPPGVVGRQQIDPANECGSLSPTGTAIDCGSFSAEGQTLRWVSYAGDGGARVDVLVPEAGDGAIWDVKLRSAGFADAPTVRTGTGLAPLVLIAQRGDAARTLEVDVVEGADPGVSLHLTLKSGRVKVSSARLDAWNGVAHDGDPVGSPSQFDHWVIERAGGAWRVTSSEAVTPDAVP